MSQSGVHWLVGVVRRAGLPGADELSVSPDVPIARAWDVVLGATEVPEKELAQIVADRFRLKVAELETAEPQAVRLVPESIAREHQVCPLRADYHRLVVATADPTDVAMEQALEFASGRSVELEVASPRKLDEAILLLYSPEKAAARMLERAKETGGLHETIRLVEDEVEEDHHDEGSLGSGPVVKLVNLLIQDAIELRASDLHLQPAQEGGLIRYRVDGVLRTVSTLPLPALSRVISRVKIIGKMDISDRLRPQDGRARVSFENRTIDLRISTVPTRNAEKAVIRFLDPTGVKELDEVGFPAADLVRFKELIDHRDGIVAVTGPTGSGKTTTMYSALRQIADEGINVMTVEDPVEFDLGGMTQIQVEPKRGVTFASALRAILRQDPDVIFVGEIRDSETAQMAVQASLTGHLVLSTLHTNDAVGSLKRLADLGVDPGAVNETFRGAVSQRLMRRPCPECRMEIEGRLSERERELADRYGVQPVYRAVGCEACGQTGYQGRTPIFQIMHMSSRLRTLVQDGGTPDQFIEAAREGGMRTLREAGVERVAEGETTLEELERILGEVEDRPEVGWESVPTELMTPEEAREAVRDVLVEEDPGGEGAAAGEAGAGQTRPEGVGAEAPDGAPTVLVVDDEPTVRTLVRALLEMEGCRVLEAVDGVEALEFLEGADERPALVILDLQMPRMDGEELLRNLRASPPAADVPVIVLTSATDTETEVRLVEAGADDFVRKPMDPRLFVTRVRAVLRRVGA